MKKHQFAMNLQLFAEDGASMDNSGVENVPAAEEQIASETGVDTSPAAEGEKQNNFEKAFAKRLSEKESQWKADLETERAKYKDYDDLKAVADYFRELNQAPDVMTLKERIEMERLQQQADEQNLPVEVLRRLQELESKAAKGEELERQRNEEERVKQEQETQQQQYKEFRTNLESFAKGKGIDADKLHKFMFDNQIGNLEAAFKAFDYDNVIAANESAEKAGVKKFLQAKGSIPTVTGSTTQGHVTSPAPKTFAEARQRAMQRLSGE